MIETVEEINFLANNLIARILNREILYREILFIFEKFCDGCGLLHLCQRLRRDCE